MFFRNLFPVLFDPDETPGGGDPAPQPSTPAPAGDAPWSSDLAGLGLDETGLAAVDGYLRQTWQPRMTQFEQQLAENAPARELWQDFHADPQQTFLDVGEQLFGEEKAAELQRLFAEQAAAAEAPTQDLDPRIQALLDEREANANAAAYREQIQQIKQAVPDLDEELFHPFVISAEGDFAQAVENYKGYVTKAQERWGTPPTEAAVPPTTLGGGGSDGPVAPPVAETYDSIDAALDATLASMKPSAVPAVGTV